MPQTAEPRPAVAWMEVLDRLETTLDRSLALADEPAQVAASQDRTAIADRTPLRRLDERLAALQAALDQAEANAAEVDALLAAEAERAQRYITALVASRQKLTEWAGRPV
jgi:flagellar motility protein MotE (MotC chaperone)